MTTFVNYKVLVTPARTLTLLLVVAAAGVRADDVRPAPQRIDVADGVYLFVSKPYGDVGLDGNSVVIVGRDGVLVFDTNGTPASAANVLAEIKRITDEPVQYVVYSHWHWDHWYGTEVYTSAFPGVRVVAHERAKTLMAGPAIEFNRPGIEQQLPAYIRTLEKRALTDPRVAPLLDEDTFFLDQKKNAHLVLPGATYSDRMVIDLGGRTVQLLHYDRAITPGDTFLYLPAERVVVAGDLLVNPITFGLSSYPTGWLKTLEGIDSWTRRYSCPVTAHRSATRRSSTQRWTCCASCWQKAGTRRRAASMRIGQRRMFSRACTT
jgi:glyoxylase-like metal-dependent hydrolase (beta-lactamase superfamily II)